MEIDAAVGRQSASAISVLNAYRAGGGLPSVVIIDIGNSGTLTPRQVDSVMDALGGVARVIFVTCASIVPGKKATTPTSGGPAIDTQTSPSPIGTPPAPVTRNTSRGTASTSSPRGAQAFADLLGGSAAG